MDNLKGILQKVTKFWNDLDKRNKIYIGIVAGILALLIAIVSTVAFSTTYIELYADDIEESQLTSIQATLQNANIKHKVSSSGKNIMVDKDKLGAAKMAISSSDISVSSPWKDALDKNTLGMTQSDKANVYRYAAEQTLANDIKNIEGVKSATVNLIIPEADPFILKQTTVAQAAVQVGLIHSLTDKQIKGIAKHVELSVKGLKAENISITDTNANILYPTSTGIGSATMEYDEIKKAREKQIEEDVTNQLAPLFDNIRVNVNLKMSFDKYKETKEIVSSPLGDDAKVGLITEEHIASEAGSSSSVSGEPGLGSNDSDTSYQMNDNGSSSKSESGATDRLYKLNTTVSELEKEIGSVVLNDSSISVIAYNEERHYYDELNKKKTFKDISWEQYKEQQRAESKTIEIPESVIDSIEKATGITNISISGFTRPTFIGPEKQSLDWLNIVPIIVLLGVIIVVTVVLVKKVGTVKVVETEPELSVENLLYSTKEKENDLPEIQEHVSDSFLRISEFINEKPDLVAQLLRNWINED